MSRLHHSLARPQGPPRASRSLATTSPRCPEPGAGGSVPAQGCAGGPSVRVTVARLSDKHMAAQMVCLQTGPEPRPQTHARERETSGNTHTHIPPPRPPPAATAPCGSKDPGRRAGGLANPDVHELKGGGGWGGGKGGFPQHMRQKGEVGGQENRVGTVVPQICSFLQLHAE